MTERDTVTPLANQDFTTYAFPGTGPGFLPRTMPARIRDVFNVKEFGATGNGSIDDRAAIVAAIQAASNNAGGIVDFPSGRYYVASKIIPPPAVSDSQGYGIHLRGSCGNNGSGGTQIFTDQRDYILYIQHGPAGGQAPPNIIRRISDINFYNSYGGGNEAAYLAAPTQTSTEPRSSIGYTDGTPGAAGTEGHGCLYLGSIFRAIISNCNITFGTGIGICMVSGYGMQIEGCDILGGFPHGSSNAAAFVDMEKKCIGYWHRSGIYRGSRTEGCSTAIVVTDGPALIENIDIENSAYGIIFGSKPLPAFNPELAQIRPIDDQARNQLSQVRGMGCEKIVHTGYWVKKSTVGGLSFTNCHMSGGGLGAQACQFGLKIDNDSSHVTVQTMWLEGYMEQAGVDMRGANVCTFRDVAPYPSGPAVPWLLRTDWSTVGGSSYGNIIEVCDQTDGGVLRSQLPVGGAGRMHNHCWVCTDSIDPAYSGGVSNLGKTIVGGGTNKVLARWNGANIVIAG